VFQSGAAMSRSLFPARDSPIRSSGFLYLANVSEANILPPLTLQSRCHSGQQVDGKYPITNSDQNEIAAVVINSRFILVIVDGPFLRPIDGLHPAFVSLESGDQPPPTYRAPAVHYFDSMLSETWLYSFSSPFGLTLLTG